MPRAGDRAIAAVVMVGAAFALAACTSGADPDGSTPPGTSAPAATDGPASPSEPAPSGTPDPWAGHFDDRAENEQQEYLAQFYGIFGDPGAAAPVKSVAEFLDPGSYTVMLECAGAPRVEASLATPDGDAGTDEIIAGPWQLACPAAVTTTVELASPGLAVLLDSGADSGAYLVQIDRTGP